MTNDFAYLQTSDSPSSAGNSPRAASSPRLSTATSPVVGDGASEEEPPTLNIHGEPGRQNKLTDATTPRRALGTRELTSPARFRSSMTPSPRPRSPRSTQQMRSHACPIIHLTRLSLIRYGAATMAVSTRREAIRDRSGSNVSPQRVFSPRTLSPMMSPRDMSPLEIARRRKEAEERKLDLEKEALERAKVCAACMHMYKCAYVYPHINTCIYAHMHSICTHIRARARAHTHTHTHAHTSCPSLSSLCPPPPFLHSHAHSLRQTHSD